MATADIDAAEKGDVHLWSLAHPGITMAEDSGESEQTVRKYVEKTPFPYPVLLNRQDSLTARFRFLGLPTVMIINRQGEITFMKTGSPRLHNSATS